MTITKLLENYNLTLAIKGRLDTMTAPDFETEITSIPESVTALNLDFSELDYLSSAGLRVILIAQKKMNIQGSMTVSNVNEMNMEVLEVTGFTQILNIL
ncbi:MAG: STAS domain-containing protein [Proteocatella sp.]